MLTVAEAKTRVHDLVALAKRAGADAADTLYVCNESTSVSVRLGALEDVERSEGETIGLRLFVGRRSASVSSSDLSKDALATLVDRAVAMAKEAPEDAYAGLAPEDRLLRGDAPSVDGDDGATVSPEALRARALAAEDASRAVAGVTNSEGAAASHGRTIIALATSHGFAGGYATSGHGCSVSVIAGESANMQRDYAHRSARHLEDLEAAEAIGRRAGERTVARLNPAKLSSGEMPILFDPRVGSSLLGHLAGAITGSSIARKTSFLLDALETEVFGKGITIVDAHGMDLKDPRLSPIYGSFMAFPPTLLLTGTRDLFLSNTIRVDRKLRDAGRHSELIVYEGESHATYLAGPDVPESVTAMKDMTAFFTRTLR